MQQRERQSPDAIVADLQAFVSVYIRAFSRMDMLRALFVSQARRRDVLLKLVTNTRRARDTAREGRSSESVVRNISEHLESLAEELRAAERVLALMSPEFMTSCVNALREAQASFAACNRDLRRWQMNRDRRLFLASPPSDKEGGQVEAIIREIAGQGFESARFLEQGTEALFRELAGMGCSPSSAAGPFDRQASLESARSAVRQHEKDMDLIMRGGTVTDLEVIERNGLRDQSLAERRQQQQQEHQEEEEEEQQEHQEEEQEEEQHQEHQEEEEEEEDSLAGIPECLRQELEDEVCHFVGDVWYEQKHMELELSAPWELGVEALHARLCEDACESSWALENFSVVAESAEEGNDKLVTLAHRPLRMGEKWVVAKARCAFSLSFFHVCRQTLRAGGRRVGEDKAIVWVYMMQHRLCEGCCSVED